MKRLTIAVGLIIAISGASISFSRPAEAAIPILQPVVNVINGLVNGGSNTSKTTTMSSPSPAATSAAKAATTAPTSTSTITGVTTAPSTVVPSETTSYLSQTPTNRISSYTYPSTKLSPEITSRLNLLAAVFAVFGVLLSIGAYELVASLASNIFTALRRGSIEEVR